MAQELLVGNQLTADMIKSGGLIVTALDKLNLIVKGAFWLLLPDQHVWRLVIASPEVRRAGPKAVYRKVVSALHRLPSEASPVGTKDISVVEDKDPLVVLLRSMISTGPGVSGIRFSKNVINGQLIEDAYLYRMV